MSDTGVSTKRLPGFYVLAAPCDQCLFSKNAVVSNARRQDILRHCARTDSHFICHKATIAGGQEVCCRAFFDRNPYATNLMRIAHRLSMVQFIEEEEVVKGETSG